MFRKKNPFGNDFTVIPPELNVGGFVISNQMSEMQKLLEQFSIINKKLMDIADMVGDFGEYLDKIREEQKGKKDIQNADEKNVLTPKMEKFIDSIKDLNKELDNLDNEFWATVVEITSPKQRMGINDEAK